LNADAVKRVLRAVTAKENAATILLHHDIGKLVCAPANGIVHLLKKGDALCYRGLGEGLKSGFRGGYCSVHIFLVAQCQYALQGIVYWTDEIESGGAVRCRKCTIDVDAVNTYHFV